MPTPIGVGAWGTEPCSEYNTEVSQNGRKFTSQGFLESYREIHNRLCNKSGNSDVGCCRRCFHSSALHKNCQRKSDFRDAGRIGSKSSSIAHPDACIVRTENNDGSTWNDNGNGGNIFNPCSSCSV